MAGRFRIGIDIGGTFTDFILHDGQTQAIRLHKTLTTPHDPSEAALTGLEEIVAAAGLTVGQIGEIVHGTTLVTNAIIERKGARLGLITTRGFRDILELGTEQRYDIYDLFLTFPEPLVGRDLRLEVGERMDRDGNTVEAIDPGEVRRVGAALVAAGCEAIAICFLNSYRNPAHEKQARAILSAAFPDVSVSLSSEVVSELWEYQRFVTTCANAYVQPQMDAYLRRLERELAARGFNGELRLMHSAGGLIAADAAREFPIRLLESGPAGGGLATALFGTLAGKTDVISFDMGGTTAKACLVEDGRCEIAPMMEAGRVRRFAKGSGLPIKTPVIEMIEIGAGGGSIAAIDSVGLLKVGPHSAGSDPGPACYGLGGKQPTVTDANLALGYYDPGFFLGGRMSLDLQAAEDAIAAIARPLGLSVQEAAWGVHKVVVDSMAAAVRVHIVEKGRDPRSYAMVGFGGAGPAHAADVARAMGVREVIIPLASGAASALGFLAAPLSFDLVRSLPFEFGPGFDAGRVRAVLAEMETEGRRRLAEAGVSSDEITVAYSADMRLVGQMHDIAASLNLADIDAGGYEAIRSAFAAAYEQRYTSVYEGARIEAVNFRVRCSGPEPKLSLAGAATSGDAGASIKGKRRAWFEHGWTEATVYDRYALRAGDRITGPAIIEEREATTVIPPGDSAVVDDNLNLRIAIALATAAETAVTPDMPLAEAQRRIQADPIALEIMWSRLINVVEEMWLTVCRTAFSLGISEAQDFACELLDPYGETLAHSPRAMPVFNLTLPRAVKALLERYPAATLKPGDVLITNDPWLCAGHLFDIAVVTPAFKDGRLVGLMGVVGHVSDIGGTRDALRAREVYEEGIQIPPMKLFDEGRPNETLLRLMEENIRRSDHVLGDVHSFVAANTIGAERLIAFMDEYGMQDLRALANVLQGLSEKAMRDAIRSIPDGVYRGSIRNNPLGEHMTFPLKLTVSGDTIELDFEGAPPEAPRGGLNCTLNYTSAHATYPLKSMLTPNVRGNAGCYRPFVVKAPEGSILNCRKPASVSMRTRTGWYLAPNIFRALSGAAPTQVQAFTGLPTAANIYGRDAENRPYSDMLFMGGGQGASAHGDGKSGLLYPTSAANTSVELIETRAPVLVIEKTCIPDSGGPGRHRGGLGQRIRLRKLFDDGRPMLVSVYPEGVDSAVDGLFGGKAGAAARGRVLDRSGTEKRDCGAGDLVQLDDTSEIVEVTLAGGAGYGSPAERDPDTLQRDIAFGYVTAQNAARNYPARDGREPKEGAARHSAEISD